MKLNTVLDNMPINKELAIYVGNELFFKGTPVGFFGAKKPKHFRSRSVLALYADKDTLKIHVSEKPTFAEGSKK